MELNKEMTVEQLKAEGDKLEAMANGTYKKEEPIKTEFDFHGLDEEKILDSMGNFKSMTADTIEIFFNNFSRIKQDFKKFYDNNDYSRDFKKRKRAEEETLVADQQAKAIKNLETIKDTYLKRIETVNPKVEGIEYQTRLSNLLKLAEFCKGEFSYDDLEFLVEAKDYPTLRILKQKYPTIELCTAFYNVDKITHRNLINKRFETVARYIKDVDTQYKDVPVQVLLDSLRK